MRDATFVGCKLLCRRMDISPTATNQPCRGLFKKKSLYEPVYSISHVVVVITIVLSVYHCNNRLTVDIIPHYLHINQHTSSCSLIVYILSFLVLNLTSSSLACYYNRPNCDHHSHPV